MGPVVEIAACEGEGARERAASRRAAESIRAIIVVVVKLIVIIVLNGYVCKKAVVHAPVSNEALAGSKLHWFGLSQNLASPNDLPQLTWMPKATGDKSKGNEPTASKKQSAAAKPHLHMCGAGAAGSRLAVGPSDW